MYFVDGHKKSQISTKYSKLPNNIKRFSNIRPSKIYPNWDFWFENKPSGNPAPWLNRVFPLKMRFQSNFSLAEKFPPSGESLFLPQRPEHLCPLFLHFFHFTNDTRVRDKKE
jgi:hypothetical protein